MLPAALALRDPIWSWPCYPPRNFLVALRLGMTVLRKISLSFSTYGTRLKSKQDIFEGNFALVHQLLVLFSIPVNLLHGRSLADCVPIGIFLTFLFSGAHV